MTKKAIKKPVKKAAKNTVKKTAKKTVRKQVKQPKKTKQPGYSIEVKVAEKLGSARLRALTLIDGILEVNMEILRAAFQSAFETDPVLFYKQFVHPLAAKEIDTTPTKETSLLTILFPDESA